MVTHNREDRVDALFEQAMGLPEAQREAFLRRECVLITHEQATPISPGVLPGRLGRSLPHESRVKSGTATGRVILT